jgi:hypothetical protein
MREEARCAIYRYEAMAGLLGGVPDAVERQAARDRARFGDTYLRFSEGGEYVWHPLLTLRFMVEVCGLPLSESRLAIIEHNQETTERMAGPTIAPEQQARELFARFGDVLEARAMAAIAADLVSNQEIMADFWREVVHCIDTITFVPEDTGSKNWS